MCIPESPGGDLRWGRAASRGRGCSKPEGRELGLVPNPALPRPSLLLWGVISSCFQQGEQLGAELEDENVAWRALRDSGTNVPRSRQAPPDLSSLLRWKFSN